MWLKLVHLSHLQCVEYILRNTAISIKIVTFRIVFNYFTPLAEL